MNIRKPYAGAAGVLLALAALVVSRPAVSSDERRCEDSSAGLARAVRWLLSEQSPDGGWHSRTYGLLRSGQSLTPFILTAILSLPRSSTMPPRAAVDRALEFIRRHVDADGAVGRMDPLVEDYPNYATALSIRALALAGAPGFPESAAPLVACLREQQFTESRGWTPAHPAYGGWGMGGPLRRFPHPGHVDLSMTRHVLQALHDAKLPPDDPVFRKAEVFLDRCRSADGGFFFSPVVEEANKAGPSGESAFRAYGSATADGLLAMTALGMPRRDSRSEAAARWIERSFRADLCPGFEERPAIRWDDGIRGYWRAAAAEALSALDVDRLEGGVDWKSLVAGAVLAEQRPDGSFRNANILMKEDDPLIATTLAVMALGSSLR